MGNLFELLRSIWVVGVLICIESVSVYHKGNSGRVHTWVMLEGCDLVSLLQLLLSAARRDLEELAKGLRTREHCNLR